MLKPANGGCQIQIVFGLIVTDLGLAIQATPAHVNINKFRDQPISQFAHECKVINTFCLIVVTKRPRVSGHVDGLHAMRACNP